MKPTRGTHGVGVMLAESRLSAESIFDAFGGTEEGLLIQEFIRESRGKDLRVLVVEGEVVGAMRRHAARGEFRANIHQQGHGEPVKLSKDVTDLAVKAAEIAGLEVAGVDILESRRGPLVVELNTSPGFEGLERATGLDVAGKILEYVVRRARAHSGRFGLPEGAPFTELAEDWPAQAGESEER